MKETGFFNPQKIIIPAIAVAVCCGIWAVVLTDNFGEKGSGLGQEFLYDITSLQKTDPALILYDEAQNKMATGFTWARSIAVDSNDRIYVTGGKMVHTFNPAGQRLALQIECEQDLSAIEVSDDGSIYLAAGDHIEVFDASGKLQNKWESSADKALLTSIAIHNDRVFIADSGNRVVHHYNTSGAKINSFGDFVIPSFYFDVALDSSNQVHVANTGHHRIESYSFDGNLFTWWGAFSNQEAEGFCGCCNPVNFALLPNKKGFVTSEKGLTRVKVYDNQGAFEGFVAGPEQFTQHDLLCDYPDSCFSPVGLDVAVDSKGRVLVLDPALAEVRVFTRKKSVAVAG